MTGYSVFASGGWPAQCRYGHSWDLGCGNFLVGWMPCSCPAAVAREGGNGHHWIACQVIGEDGKRCTSQWFDPPHDPGVKPTGYPQH